MTGGDPAREGDRHRRHRELSLLRLTDDVSSFRPLRLRFILLFAALAIVLVGLFVFVGVEYVWPRSVRSGDETASGGGGWFARSVLGLMGGGTLLALASGIATYRSIVQPLERVGNLVRNVLQSIPTGVLTVDRDGTVTSLNSAGERLLGVRASAAVGRAIEHALPAAPDVVTWVESALHGGRVLEETDVGLTRIEGQRVTVRASAAELRDMSGQPQGLVVLLRDITEVSRLELQLRRADKLAALGTLAAGVAHEVKNPLHALSLNLHLLEKEVAAAETRSAEVQEYIDILKSELRRLHRIVETFLRFSRPSMPEVRPLDLNAMLERVLSLVAFDAAAHGVVIETAFERLEPVPGDEGQLSQVFLNLAINACQAMPSGGRLTVRTAAREDWVDVVVSDTGEGISEEVLSHVFDPYFTTRPRGVGLGLAIAHRIIEGHRGTIDVESHVGRGTVMTVHLPLASPRS